MEFLKQINWFAIASVVFLFAAVAVFFLPLGADTPLMILLGLVSIVCALFSLHWVLERLFIQREMLRLNKIPDSLYSKGDKRTRR